jgi:hypothetical protein
MLYDSACTFEASARKSRPARHKSTGSIDSLQSQVQRLETGLGQALQRIEELESHVSQIRGFDGTLNLLSPSEENDMAERHSSGINLELPRRQRVVSAVDKYLTTLNSILPLFSPQKLLRCIDMWYDHPSQRDSSTWAAINVILALVHRQASPNDVISDNNGMDFLNNAHSVLNEVMVGSSKLVDIQTLAGMVLLLQGTSNLKPATTLLAIAFRLAHELRLHTRSNSEQLDMSEALERDRVFWVLFILDRDIAIRTQLPPIQSMAGIGIDYPSTAPEDRAGLVYTADGNSSFNFFLSRVELARIQGEVYEAVQSMSSSSRVSHERLENTQRLHRELDDWYARVPLPFRPNAIMQAGELNLSRAFGVLYSSHLACRSSVCQAHVMDSRWLQSVHDFGRLSAQGGLVAPQQTQTGWQELIQESRMYMKLFMSIEQKDPAFIWYVTVCETATVLD